MACLPLTKLRLYCGWPGVPNPNLGIPTGGWDNTTDSCVTNPTYPPGTKISAYTDQTVNPGYYTMIYGVLACGSRTTAGIGCISGDFSDGLAWCAHACFTAETLDLTRHNAYHDGSTAPGFVMSGCATSWSDITKGGGICLPCVTLSGNQWAFFWCEGVCPAADVTLFRGAADSDRGADFTMEGWGADWNVYGCVTGGAAWLICDATAAGYGADGTYAIPRSLGILDESV